jgi:geranylgeranyl reductase family protein
LSPKQEIHDVAVVGAGPAGATCAWYLARGGMDVALLERKKFPRDKICGDAVTSRAHVHMKRMGVLQKILAEGRGNWSEMGGFVSPGGIAYVGNSARQNRSALVIAVRRMVLDEMLALAAVEAGAHLLEQAEVSRAELSARDGLWTVSTAAPRRRTVMARVLVAADGASSKLARSLGVVSGGPEAVCSRSYVEPGTHAFEADGMVYYEPSILPGYCAILREAGGGLNYAVYLVRGGRTGPEGLRRVHHGLLENHPHIRRALGPGARLESMRAGPLRLGGVPKSWGDRFLVIGDAAGQIDPLTGEGIQYAMDAAELAARTIEHAFGRGEFSGSVLARYHGQWMDSFGKDFFYSRKMAQILARHPVFLDAFARLSLDRGDAFMLRWATIMTGSRSKLNFFRPGLALPLLGEAMRQVWRGGRRGNGGAQISQAL